jgi:ribosomal protein S18 acetylase RimI-like enzyme
LLYELTQHPGLVARRGSAPVGLLIYRIERDECEVMSLNSQVQEHGIGTALIRAVVGVARAEGCRRLWLITTNDNLPALRFYQKRGFQLVAVHAGALEAARQLKPAIPLVGLDGIPLRDEIELEMNLIAET